MIEHQTEDRDFSEQTKTGFSGRASHLWKVAVLVLGGMFMCALYQLEAGFRHLAGIVAYVELFGVQFAVYIAVSAFVFAYGQRPHKSARLQFAIVLLFAAIFRIQLVAGPPALSSDVYRYVWDGRVQASGVNPYRYIPDAPELSRLRDEKIFPFINRAAYAPTAYPPAAQMVFLAVYSIWPSSVTAFKAAASLFDFVTIASLAIILFGIGEDPLRAIVFAWHPLVVWESASSGHLDAAFIALTALGMLALVRGKNALAGVSLALATLVKFYPILLLPVFLAYAARNTPVSGATEPGRIAGLASHIPARLLARPARSLVSAFALTLVACYLPYLGAGRRVLGFLGGYFQEEGFVSSGARYFLLDAVRRLIPLPARVYILAAAAGLACLAVALMIRTLRNASDIARASIALIGFFLIVASPRYAWYFTWLVPFLALAPRLSWFYLSGAAVLLYLLWLVPDQYPGVPLWLGAIIYLPALLLVCAEYATRRLNQQRAPLKADR